MCCVFLSLSAKGPDIVFRAPPTSDHELAPTQKLGMFHFARRACEKGDRELCLSRIAGVYVRRRHVGGRGVAWR
jgi:hypothetical protein